MSVPSVPVDSVRSGHPGDHTEDFDVVIIGGGISGLATAWYVHKQSPHLRIAVLESSDDVGGKIASADLAGLKIDCGPDAFLARVPGAVELATELGLGDQLVSPSTGKAWLWSRNKLRALPEGLVLGVPSQLAPLARSGILSPRGLARAALDEVIRRPKSGADASDPTVADAIGRHLGREVVERLVDPLLGGINASDSDRLSLRSSAPNLAGPADEPHLMRALRQVGAAQQRGQIGVETERPLFLAPRTGVRTIIDALAQQLPAGTVQLNSSVRLVERTKSLEPVGPSGQNVSGSESLRRWTIATTQTRSIRARTVVFATPAFVTAGLLQGISVQAAQELSGIRTASVALTLFAFPKSSVSVPTGSGMLVPRVEQLLMTASSWWHQKWPHLATGEHVLIRASAGRDGDARFAELNDSELTSRLLADLRTTMGITAAPVDSHVARWMNGFPQYESGHSDRVARAETALRGSEPSLYLVGASYHGIGIPACIRAAKAVALSVAGDERTAG